MVCGGGRSSDWHGSSPRRPPGPLHPPHPLAPPRHLTALSELLLLATCATLLHLHTLTWARLPATSAASAESAKVSFFAVRGDDDDDDVPRERTTTISSSKLKNLIYNFAFCKLCGVLYLARWGQREENPA